MVEGELLVPVLEVAAGGAAVRSGSGSGSGSVFGVVFFWWGVLSENGDGAEMSEMAPRAGKR